MKKLTVLVFSFLLIMTACNQSSSNTEDNTTQEENEQVQETVKMCFQKTAETESSTEEYPSIDSTYIHMTMKSEDKSVEGVFNDLPAETDKMWSTFTGTLDNGIITATCKATSEGMEYEEEYIFELKDNELIVKKDGAVLHGLSRIDCN